MGERYIKIPHMDEDVTATHFGIDVASVKEK